MTRNRLRTGVLAGLMCASLGAAPAIAAPPGGDGSATEAETTTVDPDDFSIGPEINNIERHMGSFNQLSRSLGEAEKDLQADFEAFLDDPKNELLASRLEEKMAIFADQVVQDFDHVLADQDLIVDNFKTVRRKLGHFDSAIGDKLGAYDGKIATLREKVDEQEKILIGLSIKIKETDDKSAEKRLRSDFSREYRRYRLKNRNVRGLERNLHNYQILVQNLGMLVGLFTQLQDKFVLLIENLESEKDYLLEAIELQQDAVKIKKIMQDGILHGERSIQVVTEKLAQLYLQVDAFTQVHDRINMGLGQYGEVHDTLEVLSTRIDQIGDGLLDGDGDPKNIQDAVDAFFEKRNKLTPSERRDLTEEPKENK
ncbi:MAG: hypothetical protein ACYTFT_13520 [Planctomycetota bacterium]|jgi:hypothetical protein